MIGDRVEGNLRRLVLIRIDVDDAWLASPKRKLTKDRRRHTLVALHRTSFH